MQTVSGVLGQTQLQQIQTERALLVKRQNEIEKMQENLTANIYLLGRIVTSCDDWIKGFKSYQKEISRYGERIKNLKLVDAHTVAEKAWSKAAGDVKDIFLMALSQTSDAIKNQTIEFSNIKLKAQKLIQEYKDGLDALKKHSEVIYNRINLLNSQEKELRKKGVIAQSDKTVQEASDALSGNA